MREIFKETIIKNKKNQYSEFNCIIFKTETTLEININHKFIFTKYNTAFNDDFKVDLKIDIIKGDFFIDKEMKGIKNSTTLKRKNSFLTLSDVSEDTLLYGYRNEKFWGKKYRNIINKIFDRIEEELLTYFNGTSSYIVNNNITKLYKVITDYHLYKKNIKPHDGVYFTILFDYPTKKHLKNNDNKFLQSVLESYNIKNKYFISEINKNSNKNINIRTLKYITCLLGDNYIDLIKNIDFITLCESKLRFKKFHYLLTHSEKKCVINLINNMSLKKEDDIINKVYKLLDLREFLLSKNLPIKIRNNEFDNFNNIYESWISYKKIFNRGYILKYDHMEEFITEVEEPIIFNDVEYKVSLLKSELDFRNEGIIMKNCLNTHFNSGLFYLYFTITDNNKRINVQIKKNKIDSMYGKANSQVTGDFIDVSELLLNKCLKYQKMTWKTTKLSLENMSIF